ncbi:NADH dehydrogenase [ubiquinone] 1 alpha subcomplex subunit 9, mitochondrial [Anabrus simplex]|uniref:NADH dehydrogenase [ubiquinone] 1 alpha subcomplex subunit 9, mitochondrial n=1 Tax=Anabrus simplex TaxID=316456 RepID=UPI0035A39534
MMATATIRCSGQLARSQTGAAASLTCFHSPYSTDVRQIKNPDLSALRRGTGGRSSFNGIVATVFGASGFLGRYLCNRLGKIGTQLIIPYRGDHYDVLRLKLVGDLGQVLFQPYDLRDMESIRKAVKYSNVVINLVGRDWETKNFKFDDVHVKGARAIAQAAQEACVEKFIHVSALSAKEKPLPLVLPKGSQFFASKWRGEQAVREEFPDAIIFRPGTMYGQEDRFLRYYAHVWRRQFQWLPLWMKGEATIKQPVFVSDVAAAIVNAIKDPDSSGKIFQAVGPKRYKLSDLVDWFFRVMRRDEKWGYWRYDMRYDPVFKARVTLTEMICPGWPVGYLHWEGIEKEHTSDELVEGVPTLEDLGLVLTEMEDQIPWELKPFRHAAYYDEELGEFEKPAPPPVIG